MIDVEVDREIENTNALDTLLRAEFGATCCGFSTDGEKAGIRVHLLIDAPDKGLAERVRHIVMNFGDGTPTEKVVLPIFADEVFETKEGAVSMESLLRRVKELERQIGKGDDAPIELPIDIPIKR